MPSTYYQSNTSSRQHLESLVRGLSDEDLARTTPSGWTVSALLAHLAFWDRRVLVLLQRWKANGYDESPMDADMTNDALKPLLLAFDPHRAVEMVVVAAREVEAEIETLSEALIAEIEAGPTFLRLNRSLHRNDHINEIASLTRVRGVAE